MANNALFEPAFGSQVGGSDNRLLAAPPTAADAYQYNAPVMADAWRTAQDPQTWQDAAQAYGQALLAGSTAPGARGASRILDERGAPRVLYHGTTANFEKFDRAYRGDNTNAGGAHNAFFFAGNRNDTALYIEMAQAKAEEQGLPAPAGRVVRAHLEASNPLILSPFEDANVHEDIYNRLIDDDYAAIDYAKRNGHDAVIWPHGNNNNSAYTAAVFDPEQVQALPDK